VNGDFQEDLEMMARKVNVEKTVKMAKMVNGEKMVKMPNVTVVNLEHLDHLVFPVKMASLVTTVPLESLVRMVNEVLRVPWVFEDQLGIEVKKVKLETLDMMVVLVRTDMMVDAEILVQKVLLETMVKTESKVAVEIPVSLVSLASTVNAVNPAEKVKMEKMDQKVITVTMAAMVLVDSPVNLVNPVMTVKMDQPAKKVNAVVLVPTEISDQMEIPEHSTKKN